MCYTCGCKLPYERHGDADNIVEDDLKAAGQTAAITRAGVKTAKENMVELIELQRKQGDPQEAEAGLQHREVSHAHVGASERAAVPGELIRNWHRKGLQPRRGAEPRQPSHPTGRSAVSSSDHERSIRPLMASGGRRGR